MPTTETVTPWGVDTRKAAKYAGTTPGNLAQLRYQGRGPKFYKVGRKVMYRIEDLTAWLTGDAR